MSFLEAELAGYKDPIFALGEQTEEAATGLSSSTPQQSAFNLGLTNVILPPKSSGRSQTKRVIDSKIEGQANFSNGPQTAKKNTQLDH